MHVVGHFTILATCRLTHLGVYVFAASEQCAHLPHHTDDHGPQMVYVRRPGKLLLQCIDPAAFYLLCRQSGFPRVFWEKFETLEEFVDYLGDSPNESTLNRITHPWDEDSFHIVSLSVFPHAPGFYNRV
jgi:hypothetical protein